MARRIGRIGWLAGRLAGWLAGWLVGPLATLQARLLAADPAKRAMERFVLAWSVVWIAAVAALMLSRVFARWGDLGHMAIGVGLAAPLWIWPLVTPHPSERGRPVSDRHSTRFNLWVGLFAALQCYFGSELFFNLLGMQYHFPVTLILNRTPLFLYLMTVAYFSTYFVAMSMLWRGFSSLWPGASPVVRFAVRCLIGYSVAFAETWTMASEVLRDWFSYQDRSFALLVGSCCYGTLFVISLPRVLRLDEEPGRAQPGPRAVVWEVLAVNMLCLVAYAGWTLLFALLRG